MTPESLELILQLLRKHGVVEYEDKTFRVSFAREEQSEPGLIPETPAVEQEDVMSDGLTPSQQVELYGHSAP